MAAKQLGLTEVPIMVAVGWSEAQRRAYVIADNKLAINAGWDEALLRIELTELHPPSRHRTRPRQSRNRTFAAPSKGMSFVSSIQ